MAAARAAAAAAPALMESDTEMRAPTAQANGPTPAAPRFDPASAAKVLDLKGVLSPPKFPDSDRAESEFGSWKYGFTSAMALIGLDIALEDAETNRTEPMLAAIGQPHWAEARFLHALLMALCRGTAKAEVLIRSVPDKNGYLAWRKLCQVFAPRSAERHTSMLAGLLDPGWGTGPFLPQLIAWENRVADYEGEVGMPLQETIKIASVVSHAPSAVRVFLKLSPGTVTATYEELRSALIVHEQRGQLYDQQGRSVLALVPEPGEGKGGFTKWKRPEKSDKGKAKGKGKYKTDKWKTYNEEKQKQGKGPATELKGKCWTCGQEGHRAAQCKQETPVLRMEQQELEPEPQGELGFLALWGLSTLPLKKRSVMPARSAEGCGAGLPEQFLLDSGAYTHVCPMGYGGDNAEPLPPVAASRPVVTATGACVPRTGARRRVHIALESGERVGVEMEELPIKQPLLSPGSLATRGCWTIIGPPGNNSFMWFAGSRSARTAT
ncbi:unnamed protein product [Polarella glacialis]|uniref:CCHC-type domain-containing protein n=1 Tax=Polarella glacialis TaxID=89957 RepID=A0A813DHT7_POLGL|nr:unnamed protein product [Polarella glacialis]